MGVETVPGLTEGDLLRAAREAMERVASGPEGAMTRLELQHALGVTKDKVYEILHSLEDEHGLQVVEVKRRNLAGVLVGKPAYRLKGP